MSIPNPTRLVKRMRPMSMLFLSLTVMSIGATELVSSDTVSTPMHTIGQSLPFILSDNSIHAHTVSSFDTVQEEVVTPIPFDTVYEESDELYIGEEVTKQVGVNGTRTELFDLYYWNNELVDRKLLSTETIEPVEEVIVQGRKKDLRTISLEDGSLTYFDRLTMWATSYDGNCFGCTGVTYTGTNVHHGVCAVDPQVIPLGSWMYIPGYGRCHAEDIGGAIKGNDIDLGFTDVRNGWWSARYTDVYLLEGDGY